METITITIHLDTGYREKAKILNVDFKSYLAGVVLEHLLLGGPLDKLIKRVKSGSFAATIEATNRAGLGEAMQSIMENSI